MPRLFEPLNLGPLCLPNRILVAPMCQYSARDGAAGDWHLIHLGALALSGAGLLILEATAVSAAGRITAADLCLYEDRHEAALARLIDALRTYSPIPLALQLAHAGRKASTHVPWEGGAQVAPGTPGGWHAQAPSAHPFAPGQAAPLALEARGLAQVREQFVAAARRAARCGFDGLEIHAAHGYLLHEFLSPIANHRSDAYGGSLANRMRFPLEVFDAVRAAFPADRPVWVRISASDWISDGWDVAQSIEFARALAARGCAAIHVSSGGIAPTQSIPLGPGYQVPLAREIRQHCALPIFAVGLITQAMQAEGILERGEADAIALARAMLYDPRWPWHAAAELGAQVSAPPQYWRAAPREHAGLFRNTIP
jgi:2,4-dienoyl-CoA reductase-like NADH-dependent reductase (Old Yellow Enzyme family)